MSTTDPLYQLPPVTLNQLDEMKVALEVVSAGVADPDAEIFKLLDLVRKTRADAIRQKLRQEEASAAELSQEDNPIRKASLLEVEAVVVGS